MLADAGYNLEEAPKLFEHLEIYIKDEEIKEGFFFSTHPHVAQRIKNYKQIIEDQYSDRIPVRESNPEYFNFAQEVTLTNTQLCLVQGMYKTAHRNIQDFIKQHPDSAEAYYYLGEIFRQRQDKSKKEKERDKLADYPEALKAYQEAIAKDPNFALAYRGKGFVLQKQGQMEEAKKAFEDYLKYKPDAQDKSYIEEFLNESK